MRSTISTSYITPVKSDGAVQAESDVLGRGSYTLTAGTTYFFPLGGQDAMHLAAHVQWDATIVITSITVEDCNFPESEASNYGVSAGTWIDEDPTTAFVGTVGAGTTVTNGVVAAAGGAQGGAMFHVSETGARRTRLKVVVGATGGDMRVATWGKQ